MAGVVDLAGRPPVPRWLVLPAAVGVVFLVVPFGVMLSRVRWDGFVALVSSDASRAALWLSLWTCVVATLCCVVLGIPIALALAWGRGRWVGVLRVTTTLPMVLPPVVAGLLLLITWGRRGPLGAILDGVGLGVGFTSAAVIMAQVFVSLPYFVISLDGALRARGQDFEITARRLGASWPTTLRRITLPLTWPAVVSSAALAFARALGEFGATLTFAGSLEGVTRTLPLEIYLQREVDSDTALALAVLLIVVAVCSVAAAAAVSRIGFRPPRRLVDIPAGTGELAPPAVRGGEVRLDVSVPERGVHVVADFAPGGRYALIGPNGSGKSTTLSCVERQVGGTAFLNQRPILFPHLSVLDNVAFALSCRGGADPARASERAAVELRAVGCWELAARMPGTLSGGQAQRVAIARAMAEDPAVLLLDEPMAGLDARAARSVREALTARADGSGVTVIMATHDPADIAALRAEVLIFDAGRVVERCAWRDLATATAPFAADFFAGVAAWG